MNQTSSEQIERELNRRYQTTVFVILSQIAITVVLTVAAWFVAPQANVTAPAQITTILWAVLLVSAIGAFLVRRVVFAPAALRDSALLKGANDLLKSLQLKSILLSGLGEVISVIGFVIAILSGDAFDMLRAAAVALIVYFINFPLKSTWRRIIQSASNKVVGH